MRARRDRGLSEQSCSLPQTRRRSGGKERSAGAAGRGSEQREAYTERQGERERQRERAGIEERCFSVETRSLQKSGEAARLFSPEQFYARTPLPGDLVLPFAQGRTDIGTVY